MKELRSLARPYAKAIFELAAQHQQLVPWSQALQVLAEIAHQPSIQKLYQAPNCSEQKLAEIFYGVVLAVNEANPYVKNLLDLLAHYRRLQVLPFIAALFEEDKAELEKTLQITVTSAFPIKNELSKRLQKALEIRLQRAVHIELVIDETLLGGAIIRAGDLVIDGSVRSKLDKLRIAVVS